MSSDAKFIVSYIANCVGSAVDQAKEEIEQIDEKLQESEGLKLRRMKLVKVLDHLGDESYRRRRNVSIVSSQDVDTDLEVGELSVLKEKIISSLRVNGPMNVRSLITSVGSYDKDSLIIRTIKLLGDKQIVQRTDDGNVELVQ